MRVLHIAPGFPPTIGGVETFLGSLVAWQVANGHDVAVIAGNATAESREETRPGFRVHRLPFVDTLARRDLIGIAGLRRRMMSLAADHRARIIHLHPVAAEMMFMRDITRVPDSPIVTTLHLDITWQPASYRTNLHGLLAPSRAIAAVSRPLLQDAAEAFPDLADKLHLVENGLAWQNRVGIEAVPGRFLYLGRLVAEKGTDIALRALALLVDRHPFIHLTIAGDGPERPMLEALTETLALGRHVTFLGQIERARVPALIASHMALVVPSRWREPFGLVVLEAAMAGRPAIVAAVGALPDLVTHGATGLQVAAEDSEQLAAAMLRLTQAPEQAQHMGAAAAARAAAQWPVARAGEAYDELYAALAAPAA